MATVAVAGLDGNNESRPRPRAFRLSFIMIR
jgi:hypothetical protein